MVSVDVVCRLSKYVKEYVEKHGKFPSKVNVDGDSYSYGDLVYLFSYTVRNLGKDIPKKSVKDSKLATGDVINEKVYLSDYDDQANRVLKFISKNGYCPNYILTKKSKKKIKPQLFAYCFSKIIVFYHTHKNTLPKYCLYDSNVLSKGKLRVSSTSNKTNIYVSKPHYHEKGCNKLGQCTSYYCAPHSIHQGLKKLGITGISEKQLAKWAGTTTTGTGHEGIETCIAKVSREKGVKLNVEWKYLSDFGTNINKQFENIGKLLKNKNKVVFFHIGYQGNGSSKTGKVFGHYEMLDKINVTKKTVRAMNSLGRKCGTSSYCGHLQERSFNLQKHYINNKTGVKSVCIITKQ